MEVSLLLTILGIILTVILGAWSIILVVRSKYPGKIVFYIEAIIGLFDSIVKNLPELSVLYNNNNVSQNLFLLKGCFLNSGTKDISEAMVEEKISLIFPSKNYQILTARVVPTDANIKASIEKVSSQKLIFNLGLFRIKEYFRLEALIEILPDEELYNGKKSKTIINDLESSIEFTHRIADTKKIEKKWIGKISSDKIFPFVLLVALFSIGFFLAIIFLPNHFPIPMTLHYKTVLDDKSTEFQYFVRADSTIELTGVNNDYEQIVSLHEFKDLINRSDIKIAPRTFPLFLYYLLGIVFFLVILLGLTEYFQRRSRLKILKQIGLK
jgi:hypothetical protein